MKTIERETYLERLKSLQNTPDIKVITGMRRAGKSFLMNRYIDWLHTNDKGNIIYIDLMLLQNAALKDYIELNRYIESQYMNGTDNYLFIDEVQLCANFEWTVNSLHATGKYDIYITGSNAFLLSSDLATLFTGRYIEIRVFPFSFSEYCTYFDEEKDLQKQLERYVVEGGLAGSYIYSSTADRMTYLKHVFTTIVERDLAQKYKIADPEAITRVAEFLMDNISNTTSANNVANELVRQNLAINHVSARNYIRYLTNAFMFEKVNRYDMRGKKILLSLEKYYLTDLGLRYALLGMRNMDWGRAYENIVCIELMRRGYQVYVGKLYQKEVDFVAMRGSEKIYIQVSDNISSSSTLQRELEPLTKIPDAYPKCLIANTRHDTTDYQGIKIYDLAMWLR